MMPSRGFFVLLVVVGWVRARGWRQWKYNSTTPQAWTAIWGEGIEGPRGRMGHSMVLDGTRIILFGGRDDETRREHTPRTFDVQEVEGARSFTTYDRLPIYGCVPSDPHASPNETYYGECDNTVPVGLYYNDVWMYDLNCTR
jgi:hypothetical protein